MATKVASRSRRSRLLVREGIKMWKTVGGSPVTYYSCGAVDRAIENGVGLLVVNAAGKKRLIAPHRVHRVDLTGVYSDVHENAGEGKYINLKAFTDDGKSIIGAQHVNPFLSLDGEDRCNYTFIEAFKNRIGTENLKSLKANVLSSFSDGTHLHWVGKRNSAGAVAASPFYLWEELWNLASKLNPEMTSWLRSVKSGKKGVTEHASPKEKFFHNLCVMRRARETRNVVTGETSLGGGATPYAMPLIHMEMAIDMYFLTDGFTIETDAEGKKFVNETGNYYYRFVIGRSIPWILYRRDWKALDVHSPIAYKSEELRQHIIEVRKQIGRKVG